MTEIQFPNTYSNGMTAEVGDTVCFRFAGQSMKAKVLRIWQDVLFVQRGMQVRADQVVFISRG